MAILDTTRMSTVLLKKLVLSYHHVQGWQIVSVMVMVFACVVICMSMKFSFPHMLSFGRTPSFGK